MGWLLLLALLLVVGLPLALLFWGVVLSLWLTWAAVTALWGLLTWLLGDPVVAVLLALVIGIVIGRAGASASRGPSGRRDPGS